MSAPDAVVCSRCGERRTTDEDPRRALTWATDSRNGVLRWLCPRCAREHVRDIEGQLPSEYW